jgi:hypothetical protein
MKTFPVSHWQQAPQGGPAVGRGLSFNGTNQLVELPVNMAWFAQGTISLWLYAQRDDESYFGYFNSITTGHSQSLWTRFNRLNYFVWDGSFRVVASPPIGFNRYHHVVAWFQNNVGVWLNLNGEFVGNTALGTQWSGGSRVLLGYPYPGGERGGWFNGRLHSLHIYPYLLTGAQARQLYDEPESYFGGGIRYEFEQNSGNSLLDTSGNNLHGNLQNYPILETTPGPQNRWVDRFGTPIF